MRAKNFVCFTLIIFFLIFYILGSTMNCEAFIGKINFTEVVFGLKNSRGKIAATKTGVFGGEMIFYPSHITEPEQDCTLAVNDIGKQNYLHSDLIEWNIDINNKIFHLFVNRRNGTITIRGKAEDWKEKEKVEHIIKSRAPDNFQLINEIDTHDKCSG